MIIINFFGGLGNQLFQYALGRYLQLEKGCEVKFLADDVWKPALDSMNCQIEYCSQEELKSVRKEENLIQLFTRKIESAVKPELQKRIIENYGHPFDPEMLSIKHSCQLIGYWQTYVTANAIRGVLLDELKPLNEFSQSYKQLECQISRSENTVSMHIRRGDYLNANTLDVHGIVPLEFYRAGTEMLQSKLETMQVFVFSDDIEWAMTNIDWLQNPIFVTTENHLEDFFLMTQCNHNIIANSSFSWWGAWLNQNENKKVIYPERWFANREFNTDNFIPENWISL